MVPYVYLFSDCFRSPRNCFAFFLANPRTLLLCAGLAMPLFVPKEWSEKRDTRLRNERREASNAKVRDALVEDGMYF